MRTKVILNPWADRGRAVQLRSEISRWASNYGQLDIDLTERVGHAQELANAAVEDGYERVVAAGGDGTVHEVVNGLVQNGRGRAQMGVIPIGSGNDFAYGLGLLRDPETAVHRLFTGQPQMIDLARIEDEYGRHEVVDNGVGVGFDAAVTINSYKISWIHGFAMYTLATLQTIAFSFDAPLAQLRFDDQEIEQNFLLLAIGVGPRAGGGFYLTPDAVFDDDRLDSCTVNPVGRLTMLQMLPRVMKGSHVTSKHVTMRRSRSISITADRPLAIHADGEIFAYPERQVHRVTITSLPQALSVIV